MNERNLYDDEFEKLLKEKADQFKMYPSDKVWNEVNKSLHTRRRRFVAGMTILIGGFLIVAGAQLISPSQHTHPDTIAAKTNSGAKTASANDFQSTATNGFAASPVIESRNPHTRDQDLNTNSPFALNALVSSDIESVATALPESQTVKIQSPAHVNAIQQTEGIFTEKPVASLTIPALNETEQSSAGSAVINAVSAELAPEKSITHLTHARNDRFSWEIYITPTLNTRYLTGLNAQTLRQSLQNAPIMVVRFANVNGFVDNTPAMGYNLGGNIVYRISKNISLKAGVEFSYSRYYIKAYNSNPSQTSTSLSPYMGYIPPDSTSNYNAGNGINIEKGPQRYQNKYYQLSVPIGVEMKVAGQGKLQLHLGATIQPSYLLNTDAYVLSEDYNTYAKDPAVFRRWNLNAGGEAFISYGVGKIRWEIGPQVRYQIFSTYKNGYPFNENMLNYGIRIGFSKTIW